MPYHGDEGYEQGQCDAHEQYPPGEVYGVVEALHDHNAQRKGKQRSQKGEHYEGSRLYKTSQGLSGFVENFRKLTLVPDPVLSEVNLLDMGLSLKSTYPDIEWRINLPRDTSLMADEGMLRQVLVNLTKNAIEAGTEVIDLRWKDNALMVSNNGAPIPPEVAREIFIPFFSTKRSGGGIGLPLLRQMMHRQELNLHLAERPVPGFRTTFVISPLNS